MVVTDSCTFTRIKGGTALRTAEVSGRVVKFPRLGESFYLKAKSLTPGGTFRLVNTSPLKEIKLLSGSEGLLLVTASGSEYLLEAR